MGSIAAAAGSYFRSCGVARDFVDRRSRPAHPSLPRNSKIKLQGELDNPRIAARGDDATKIAGIQDLPCCWIDTASGGDESIQVADGIGEIRMIEQIEKLNAKFEGL